MKEMKLFQYAIFYNPTEEEAKNFAVKPHMLVEVTNVLASNEQEVVIIASRAIPEDYMHRLKQVNIVVRPF